MKTARFAWTLIFFHIILMGYATNSFPNETEEISSGQVVYVPAYSHIYIGNAERPFFLTVTLSIRNVNRKRPVTITLVDYYETQGELVRKYIDKPVILKPLESLRYVIPEKNKEGGSGANFIVEWYSETPVNAPIIETIMISARSQQGMSFTSRGRVIAEAY